MINTSDKPQADATSVQIKIPAAARAIDLLVSAILLVLLSPVFLVLGLLVKFSYKGPILQKLDRVGQNGTIFKLFKFRTVDFDENEPNPDAAVEDMVPTSKLGVFLQRTKLDELPQLFNIIRGDLALVGPKPQLPRPEAQYTVAERQLQAVRPGLTGPAALYIREMQARSKQHRWEEVYLEQVFPHLFPLDLKYMVGRTIWTDFVLVLKTVFVLTQIHNRIPILLKIRNRHLFLLDILIFLVTPILALTLRMERLDWWQEMGAALVFYAGIAALVKLSFFYILGVYRRFWRYARMHDLVRLGSAVALSTIILLVIFLSGFDVLGSYQLAMYRSVPFTDGLLTLILAAGVRLCLRGAYGWHRQHKHVPVGRRVLVVGAGEAGNMVVREMFTNPQLNMEPVAFVDDDVKKLNSRISGLPVLGTTRDIPALVEQHRIQQIIVAMPSTPLGKANKIIETCKRTGITTYVFPGAYEILAGYKTVNPVPRYEINRLLRREPIVTDKTAIADYLANKTVLVTGAGGSIGSELSHQIARCQPAAIVLLGHGENSIFEIRLSLRLSFPDLVTHSAIVDVRDQHSVDSIVRKYQPDIIFHAAAHKHVPFMEDHVCEAITNNIMGTRNVLQAAEQHHVARFVLISTDKAVNPTSIMGATKRMAELLVIAAAQRTGRAYMAVRFGNVLGSRGSVLRVFERQIANGGPLTVTHPDMTRYFMTIPEAVQLVMQAAILGQGSEVFVLDMGEPVRIKDMATDLIKLAGLEPGLDIEISYSGIRPGEKLNEELFLSQENYRRTAVERIFCASYTGAVQTEILEQIVFELVELAKQMQMENNSQQMLVLLPKICYYIDKYQPQFPSPPPDPTAVPKTRTTTPPPQPFHPDYRFVKT